MEQHLNHYSIITVKSQILKSLMDSPQKMDIDRIWNFWNPTSFGRDMTDWNCQVFFWSGQLFVLIFIWCITQLCLVRFEKFQILTISTGLSEFFWTTRTRGCYWTKLTHKKSGMFHVLFLESWWMAQKSDNTPFNGLPTKSRYV